MTIQHTPETQKARWKTKRAFQLISYLITFSGCSEHGYGLIASKDG